MKIKMGDISFAVNLYYPLDDCGNEIFLSDNKGNLYYLHKNKPELSGFNECDITYYNGSTGIGWISQNIPYNRIGYSKSVKRQNNLVLFFQLREYTSSCHLIIAVHKGKMIDSLLREVADFNEGKYLHPEHAWKWGDDSWERGVVLDLCSQEDSSYENPVSTQREAHRNGCES
jgi:hypothetical protein